MKLIELSKNGTTHKGKYFAQVDDEDFEFLNKFIWRVVVDKHTCYAATWVFDSIGNKKSISMHRLILGIESNRRKGDHIDHNGLNNQRSNLRIGNARLNNANRIVPCGISGYRGVTIIKNKNLPNKWGARISFYKKTISLGNYPFTPCGALLAALKYDIAAEMYHGGFAVLNFPKP